MPLIDFRLQSLAISPRYYLSGGCLSSHICKFHFFFITVFVNILQLSFSIYIFSNLNMVIRSSNSCFSLFIYRGTPHCDHPVYTTTSCLSSPPIVFHPDMKISESFYFEDLFNATTSVSRPGLYGPTLDASTGFHCIEINNNNNNNN